MASKKQLLPLLLLICIYVCSAEDARAKRNSDALERCIKMADPLVQNSEYIFPLTTQDIRDVCKMWDGFVDCIRNYTSTYLTSGQQASFEAAIDPSLQSIMLLCREDPNYQKAYLSFAPCMKRIAMDDQYCGNNYQYLADVVKGKANDPQLCCANHKFRECFLGKSNECDREVGTIGGQNKASDFMRSMLDRALSFLLQQCTNYVPNSRDCPLDSSSLVDGNTGLGSQSGTGSNGGIGGPISNNGIGGGKSTGRGTTVRPGTSKFTWTTRNPLAPKPTQANIALGGNSIGQGFAAQFKGSATTKTPIVAVLILSTVAGYMLA